jgi:cyclomaltodextrin glucanotransferase
MNLKRFFIVCLFLTCANANADWYLRGTHNAWGTTQMVSAGAGTNTVQVNNVVFYVAGAIKFDRFGDWKENYGVGGFNGRDIPVAAGTWNIKFYTDTKNWNISPAVLSSSSTLSSSSIIASSKVSSSVKSSSINLSSSNPSSSNPSSSNPSSSPSSQVSTVYYLRGTHNGWVEGDLFTAKAGSTTNFEICRNFSAGDANGGPRFKVDPNGSWGADTFPAVDVAASGWTKIEINTVTKTIVSTTIGLGNNCSAAPVADDFRARTMYFMFVDRFFDGNPNNNTGNNAVATSTVKGAGDISQWKKYWGGDIAGIIAKLDYLQDLGVTAIWVTPLMNNVDQGTEGIYHGYQSIDFYSVDEHLGDWALVDELNAQMELRGMKLVLDIALNHSNHAKDNDKGLLLKEGQFITDFATGKGNWYHNNGTILDCGAACANDWNDPVAYRNKMLFDLADFNHGVNANSDADNYMIGAALKWMDHGVDAFRIDAIKHIEPGFVNRFTAAVRAKKADTYVFGEWYGAGASDSASMQFLGENRGSELLDFNLRDNIENAIAGNSTMIDLSNHIKLRAGAMNSKEDLQTIFLDNHDATRTSVYLQHPTKTSRGNGKGMAKDFADARQNLGMALVMTLPGIPVVYYGTEHNTAWFVAPTNNGETGGDPYNREQMPSFNKTTAAYNMISALAKLRKESVAVQAGAYAERWSTADVLVFQRQEGNDCAVVAINRGAQTTISVPNLCLTTGAYVSKVGSDVVNVTAGSGSFTLSQNEVVVLR